MKVWLPAEDALVSGTREQLLSVIGQQSEHPSPLEADRVMLIG